MTTLSTLRALLDLALTHPDAPALLRLPVDQRTMEGLARAYLPHDVRLDTDPTGKSEHRNRFTEGVAALLRWGTWPTTPLDLTDPGTACALLVALALALGLDPGPLGLGVSWYRYHSGWCLEGSIGGYRRTRVFHNIEGAGEHHGWRYAPAIAAEPDDARALSLAATHLLAR